MHVAVITVPDGLSARNFCGPEFLEPLTRRVHPVLWHHLTDRGVAEVVSQWGDRLQLEPLPPVVDHRTLALLRWSRTLAQLACYREPAAEAARARAHIVQGPKQRVRRAVVGAMARSGSTPRGLARLDRWHDRVAARLSTVNAAEEALRALGASVVFIPNQRSIPALPVAVAARRVGVPLVGFVYSWDNLPKRRSTILPDHWLVWGPRMRSQVLRYHPDTDPARVHEVGTPQFEVHTRPELRVDRAGFLEPLGLDPARPVICFSGDDATTSPFDQVYLADLAGAVASLPDSERPQILFRRAPVDHTRRYDAVLAEHPDIAVSNPAWYATGRSWEGVVPSIDDQALLANVVAHCDLVVNVGSTMAMDFAVVGKPAVYLAYQPDGAAGWDIDTIYRLPHFRSVHRNQPVHWARERHLLADVVTGALADPAAKAQGRAAWLAEELTFPIAGAGERAASVVAQIAAGEPPPLGRNRR